MKGLPHRIGRFGPWEWMGFTLYCWWRHWHLERRAFGRWWILGVNTRPHTERSRRRTFRICAYVSPDATPSHPKARGFGVRPRVVSPTGGEEN